MGASYGIREGKMEWQRSGQLVVAKNKNQLREAKRGYALQGSHFKFGGALLSDEGRLCPSSEEARERLMTGRPVDPVANKAHPATWCRVKHKRGDILRIQGSWVMHQGNCRTNYAAGLALGINGKYPWADVYSGRTAETQDVPGDDQVGDGANGGRPGSDLRVRAGPAGRAKRCGDG